MCFIVGLSPIFLIYDTNDYFLHFSSCLLLVFFCFSISFLLFQFEIFSRLSASVLISNVLADLLQVGLNLLSEISFLHFQQEERRRNLRFKYSNFHSHSVIASAV